MTDVHPSSGKRDPDSTIRILPSVDDDIARAAVFPFVRKGEPVETSEAESAAPLGRWALVVATACALAVTFAQDPGRIVSDTKLPVLMSPLTYMANALHLWNQGMWSGSIQTLDFGYIFPMGVFFGAAHLLHVPVWCTERVWLALLLTTGFWGMVRLAEALRIGNRTGRILGALVYVVAPIVVTWASTSAALLAVVLLPWVLVPLVRGASEGSPRRAACASGVAVAFMGGVNSTVVLATLPVGAIWLLTRQPGRRRRALISWWIVAVGLACFWWAAALTIQSRFGYNYLPYTETSQVTTATASLFESLRGASYWLDYFTLGGPILPGAWTLVSQIGPIIGTAVVVAVGLAGLVRRIPERLFLVATLAVGVLVIASGYGGALGGPLATPVQHLLSGRLAELRNISKFSPDVALPLALGFASMVSSPLRLRRRATSRADAGSPSRRVRAARPLFALVVVAAIVLAATPFWRGQLYPQGTFSAIPAYWSQTADWLGAHQDHGTALLAPGASFGEYTWGRPLDEPLSVLTDTSWSVRSLVPVGSNGNDQILDTFEASLEEGVAYPGMAQFLARSGYDDVVVRNDLNLGATNAPAPAQVRQVLSQTSGLKLVASFGPVISQAQANPTGFPVYDQSSITRGLRSVQIYQVEPPSPEVRTYPVSDPVIVSGSPSSLLVLLEERVLDGRAALLAGDIGSQAAAATPDATWADTDGNQRRDTGFGTIPNSQSYVLGPDQRSAIAQSAVPQSLAVVNGTAHQTVAKPLGAASVSASSFSSTPLALDSAQGPSAAFDDNRSTSWVADAKDDSVGQWVKIEFGRAVPLRTITVRPLADGAQRPKVTRIEISTARGSVQQTIHDGANTLAVRPGPSTWLKVTLTTVQRARVKPISVFPLGAGLTSVAIPGVHYAQALSLPADESSIFAKRGGQVLFAFDAPLTNANLTLGQTNDDDPLMIRRFSAPATATVSMLGLVTPTPGPGLSALLPSVSSSVQVTASSTLGQLPRFAASNLLTGSGLPWIAGQGDHAPSLTFRWSGARDGQLHRPDSFEPRRPATPGEDLEPQRPRRRTGAHARWRHHVPGDDHRHPHGPVREGGAADRPRARDLDQVRTSGRRRGAAHSRPWAHRRDCTRQPHGRPAVWQWADRAGRWSRTPDAGAWDSVRPREPPTHGPRGLQPCHAHRRQPHPSGGAPRWDLQGHNPGRAARNRAERAGRPFVPDRRVVGNGQTPDPGRTRCTVLSGSGAELQQRLESDAERARPIRGATRRMGAGLRRSGRIRRHGHHDLPGRHLVPGGVAHRRFVRGRPRRSRIGPPWSPIPAAGT